MAVRDQVVTDKYAAYNGDCITGMAELPNDKVRLSIYSPPFLGLYQYSSDERDLSNARNHAEFFEHYNFVLKEVARVTMPGRISCVHACDVPTGNSGRDHLIDFPGAVIQMHEKLGMHYIGRYCIWKEPLRVRNRTMMKCLAHKTIVDDATSCGNAGADYLLVFRKRGNNPVPVTHETGFHDYIGERRPPSDLLPYRGWTGKQTENRLSHWIWRRYASSFWDDIRIDRVLPFKDSKDPDDEKHVHALQLDVIERCVVMWSNPGEVVLTPFMGVGSEVYGAVINGRKGVGFELKPSYYRQAVLNLQSAATHKNEDQRQLFGEPEPVDPDAP